MPRRSNSFARALKDAEKDLEKAQNERARAQARLIALDAGIPALQRTIQALQQQLNGGAVTGERRAETSADALLYPSTSELEKLVGPQNLSGMGSIPPKMPTEDELLPDDF